MPGEEGLHLGCAGLLGMAFGVEEDSAPDPMDIGLAGARRAMYKTNGVINLFE